MKLAQVTNRDSDEGKEKYYNLLVKALEIDPNDAEINQTMGNFYYEIKHLLKAIDYMDRAYSLDNNLVDAAANAIHIRFSICAWGTDGVNYKKDLEMLKKIAQKDSETCHDLNATEFKISPIHPHMTLAYPINSTQKLEITRSFSRAEQRLLIKSGLNSFNDTSPRKRSKFLKESRKPGFRVKVGYVSANIKSKTTVYMAQVISFPSYNIRMGYEDIVITITISLIECTTISNNHLLSLSCILHLVLPTRHVGSNAIP
jgi:predicted O-linked N-acetylglucosamine transferase (SPINDLY family)